MSHEHDDMMFLGCGRVIGSFNLTKDNNNQAYYVGSLFNFVELNLEEFNIYMELKKAKTQGEWVKNCLKNRLIAEAHEIENYERKYREEHLLIHQRIQDINDKLLQKYTIIKRGIISEFSNELKCWIIGSANSNGNWFTISQEEYDLWRSASGVGTIFNAVYNFKEIKNCSVTEALEILLKYIYQLNKAGLWNIEYCGENHEVYITPNNIKLTLSEKWFHVDDLNGNSPLIAVGEEFNVSSEGKEVILGNQKMSLNESSFLVWILCKKSGATINKINKLLELPENQINSIVMKLIERKLLMIWPSTWSFGDDYLISASPLGSSIGYMHNELYEIKDIMVGDAQELPLPVYFIWVFSHGLVPLGTTVDTIKEILAISQEQAELLVSKCIPILLEKGLINVQLIPEMNYMRKS